MAQDVLRILSHRPTQAVLTVLAVEPSYPRRIANLLGLAESEVTRCLRRLEAAGIVTAAWHHVGKNVRLYTLVADTLQVRVTRSGVETDLGQDLSGAPGGHIPIAVPPPAPQGFLGRDEELRLLAGPENVLLVEGMPGIGKTSLLTAFAARQRDPVFWVTLRGIETPGWLANHLALFMAKQGERALLDSLDASTQSSHMTDALLAALDRDGQVVIFDDAHRVEDPALRALLDEAVRRMRQGKLILSGRQRLPHAPREGLRTVLLSGLGDEDVRTFLAGKGIELPDDLLPRVRAEVGGHPLALILLAEASASSDRLVDLLDRRPEQDLADYLLQELVPVLSEAERHALAHASLFRAEFTLEDLEALSARALEPTLFTLRRRLLVTETEDGFRLHEVVRNYFYERIANRKGLHGKVAERFLGRGSVEGRLEAMHHLLIAGLPDRVLRLLEEDLDLDDYHYIDSGCHRLYAEILATFAREEVKDPRHWAIIEDERADLAFHRGEVDEALQGYLRAGVQFAGLGDPERCADLAWKTGLCLERLGRVEEAAGLAREALRKAPRGKAHARLADLVGHLAPAPGDDEGSKDATDPRVMQ